MKISRMAVLMLLLAGCVEEGKRNCAFKEGDVVRHKSNKSVEMVVTEVRYGCTYYTRWVNTLGVSEWNIYREIELEKVKNEADAEGVQ